MSKRFDYVKYNENTIKKQERFKGLVLLLEKEIDTIGQQIPAMARGVIVGRPKSLAFTALEEVYMWIGKALKDEQIFLDSQAKATTQAQEERKNS